MIKVQKKLPNVIQTTWSCFIAFLFCCCCFKRYMSTQTDYFRELGLPFDVFLNCSKKIVNTNFQGNKKTRVFKTIA